VGNYQHADYRIFHCFADAIYENCKELSLYCIGPVVLIFVFVSKCNILSWM